MSPWRRARGPGETLPSTIKRRHARYLLNTGLAVISGTGDQQINIRSRAVDISESGVGGVFHENWKVGIRVELEMSLPVGPALLNVAAIVRHHTGTRYGFEFIDISPEQRGILRDACKLLGA